MCNSCISVLKQNYFEGALLEKKSFYINKELNKLETQEKRIVLKSNPVNLMIILTRRCNLKCIMCPRIHEEKIALPLELVGKLYPLFPYLEWIDWQGGEVFLVDYFKKLFLEISNRQPHILQHITTNGLLIDKEWAEIFSQSNVDLLYSIDGVTKDVYEYVRTGARFDDLIRSLELINEFKEKRGNYNRLEMTAVVMKCNYKNLSLFPDFCKRYNFNSLTLNFLQPEIIPEQDILINPDPEAISYLRVIIPQIKNTCKEYNIEFKCMFESRLIDSQQHPLDKNIKADPYDCIYPWTRIHVQPDGKVYPACQCSLSIGDLKNNTWEDIWNGHTMQLYRNLIFNGRREEICSQQCLIYPPD